MLKYNFTCRRKTGLKLLLIVLLFISSCADSGTVIGNPEENHDDQFYMSIAKSIPVNETILNNNQQTDIGPTESMKFVLSPNGETLYLLNRKEKTLSMFNTATTTIEQKIDIEGENINSSPTCITTHPDGEFLFIGYDRNDEDITVIDTATHSVADTLSVELPIENGDLNENIEDDSDVDFSDWNPAVLNHNRYIAVSPDGSLLYYTVSDSIVIIDINANQVSGIIESPGSNFDRIGGFALNSDGSMLYAAFNENLLIVDTDDRGIVAQSPINDTPTDISLSQDGLSIYISDLYKGVSSITTSDYTVTSTVNAGTDIVCHNVIVSPNGRYVFYTGNNFRSLITDGKDEGVVGVIDTKDNSIIQELQIDKVPNALEISPDGKTLYALTFDMPDMASYVGENMRVPTYVEIIECSYNAE